MGHNCGTCTKCKPHIRECDDGDGHYDVWEDGVECAEYHDEMESTHPSDLHPCAHGEAVVAIAVAQPKFWVNQHGIVFADIGDHLTAFCDHAGKWTEWHFTEGSGPDGKIVQWVRWMKFAPESGELLPTAAQLPEMYERWQQSSDSK
jgi:hypothetical protein